MRLLLNPSVRRGTSMSRLSPSSQSSFAARLTAGEKPEGPSLVDTMNAALDDDSLMQTQLAMLRARLDEYRVLMSLMYSLMLNPGPSPTLDRVD